MHEVVYDFFWAPAAGHNRSLRGEKGVLHGRKSAWNRLLCHQIVPHGGLYLAGLPVMSDFIPLDKERLKTLLKSIYSESVKIRLYRLPTLSTWAPQRLKNAAHTAYAAYAAYTGGQTGQRPGAIPNGDRPRPQPAPAEEKQAIKKAAYCAAFLLDYFIFML